jgi:hypothetical protein
MSDVKASKAEGLVKLTGTIANYKCTRAEASFVFNDSDRTKLGVVAIAAGIVGLSGQAISTAASAISTEEDADYVEFDLDGTPVKGWVWRSPFKEGDKVEVAAEWNGGHYETGAITRPVDRIIALYPHCSRGTRRHVKNAGKWWFVGVTMLSLLSLLLAVPTFGLERFWHAAVDIVSWTALAYYIFFGVMTISLARKWMPFVRLTEKVCRTLGFSDPGNVDFVKSSKAQRKPDDPGEFGTFYFRY